MGGEGNFFSSYSMRTGGFYVGLERPSCEADHLPPSNVEVNMWNYTKIPQYVFREWHLVKQGTITVCNILIGTNEKFRLWVKVKGKVVPVLN
jgi:hypothetical protein